MRPLTSRAFGALVTLLGLAATAPVLADDARAPAANAAPAPKAAKGKREKLPVKLTVSAPSPDPAWTVRIENTGASPVRLAADPLLLSFELVAKKGGKRPCKLPAAMKPSAFPIGRELYLQPGEFWEESIDPRLYCFGDTTDLLTEGTKLTPRYGWSGWAGDKREPFAAQGLDRPERFDAQKEIVGDPFVLPALPGAKPAAASPGTPPVSGGPDAVAPPPAPARSEPSPSGSPSGEAASAAAGEAPGRDLPGQTQDLNAPHLDVYSRQLIDAPAARDIVIQVRAVNEGKRQLLTVLRSRMLHFRVEELKADNTARVTVDCVHQNAPHGIAREMIEQVPSGRSLSVPVLVAEICPLGTFSRPGLYRITPVLDTSMGGESLKVDPWVGRALAAQASLVRLATGRQDFHAGGPVKGPLVTVPPGAPANDVRPAPPPESPEAKPQRDQPT